jgi:hypothetical protein
MHSKILVIAVLFTAGAVASCWENRKKCEWHGTSPNCGSTNHQIGDTNEQGKVLVDWTKIKDHAVLCATHEISNECCNDYGNGCFVGYKRLWCEK